MERVRKVNDFTLIPKYNCEIGLVSPRVLTYKHVRRKMKNLEKYYYLKFNNIKVIEK